MAASQWFLCFLSQMNHSPHRTSVWTFPKPLWTICTGYPGTTGLRRQAFPVAWVIRVTDGPQQQGLAQPASSLLSLSAGVTVGHTILALWVWAKQAISLFLPTRAWITPHKGSLSALNWFLFYPESLSLPDGNRPTHKKDTELTAKE